MVTAKKLGKGKTVSSGPVMVKEKKTAIVILKDVKTKINKWPKHHHKSFKAGP